MLSGMAASQATRDTAAAQLWGPSSQASTAPRPARPSSTRCCTPATQQDQDFVHVQKVLPAPV